MTAIDDCDIFEVSTPELHDVVRLEDRYGRPYVVEMSEDRGNRLDRLVGTDAVRAVPASVGSHGAQIAASTERKLSRKFGRSAEWRHS